MPKITDLTDEQLQDALDAVTEHGTIASAAVALGLARTTLRDRVHRAAHRGLTGALGGAASPGFYIARKSPLHDKDGNKVLEWRQELPDKIGRSIEDIKEAFAEVVPHPFIPGPTDVLDDGAAERLTVYPIADHHLGLLAWGAESGDDYDLNIASAILMRTFKRVIDAAPPAAVGVVLSLGDFFHADNDEQTTRRSGNKLSVDGRHDKVLMVGIKLLIFCIELALEKHPKVVFRAIRGNHDPDSTSVIRIAMWAYFRENPRVEIDMNPSPFWIYQHGTTLLTAAHGDMVKPADFPGMVAARWPEIWGATLYRYGLFGHVHHKSLGGGEKYGMVWETFNTLSAKDDFHSGHGYVSIRNMVAISYSLTEGEEGRVIRNYKPN